MVAAIPAQTVGVGETANLEMSAYFDDPDGDALSYVVESADTGVAAVSVERGTVTIAAVAKGETEVGVTARDPAGLAFPCRFASSYGDCICVFGSPDSR